MARRLGRFLVFALPVTSFVAAVLFSIAEVAAGRGLHSYLAGDGGRVYPLMSLVSFGLVALLVPVAVAAAWWTHRRRPGSKN
jgi:hypothetical protein